MARVAAPVHIIGMGVLGSMLAWQLHRAGIGFTWEDSESRFVAWEASSGLVYPSGDALDQRNYEWWLEWFESPPWAPLQVLEKGAFWFLTKFPPNNAKYQITRQVGPLHLGSLPSYHVNVPALVLGTRRAFASQRAPVEPLGTHLVVHAHGFTPLRLDHLVWGWTVRATLSLDGGLRAASGGLRPCLYLRTPHFQFGYVNPLPGDSSGWIGGSSHVSQRIPRHLIAKDKVDNWKEFVTRTTHGLARVVDVSDPIDGWRPVGRKTDLHAEQTVRSSDGVLWMPPMSGNGVRHGPLVAQATCAYIQTHL